MSHGQARVLTAAVLLLITYADTTPAQRRRASRTPTQQRPTIGSNNARRVGPDGNEQYWAAQRSIEAAIQQLEAYLRESPDGERASTARQQLAVLRNLTAASRPKWVPMGRLALRDVPEWRISSIHSQADRTRLIVEVVCRREDGGSCYFRRFDRFPLVLVDGSGRYYPMLESSDLPPDVRYDERERRAVVSGGRSFTITVDFAPLATGAVSGQIYYRDENQAQPARFSLVRGKAHE